MRSRLEACRPVGPLAELCTKYRVPSEVQGQLARRTGTLIGTPQLPVSRVEGDIQRFMESNRGAPDWDQTMALVATDVKEIYRKMKK